MKTTRHLSVSLAIVLAAASAPVVAAQAVAPATASTTSPSEPVFTRARVASFSKESDGKLYVQLKLLPKSKLPFTTQTFRVQDRALLADIAEGTSVKFTSARIDGENVVTALHRVAECKRFQACD